MDRRRLHLRSRCRELQRGEGEGRTTALAAETPTPVRAIVSVSLAERHAGADAQSPRTRISCPDQWPTIHWDIEVRIHVAGHRQQNELITRRYYSLHMHGKGPKDVSRLRADKFLEDSLSSST